MIVEELVPAGTVLIREGDQAHAFFVLLSGAAVVERNGEAIGCLEPDAIFGELALLTDQPRKARVQAKTPVRCLAISRSDLSRLLEREPRIAVAMLPKLAERVDAVH